MAERRRGPGRVTRAGRGAQRPLWARFWALGPCTDRGVQPYVSHVASGTGQEEAGNADATAETYASAGTRPAETGGEHHEQADAEGFRQRQGVGEHVRRAHEGPGGPGAGRGGVPGHHRGGRGDHRGAHDDELRQRDRDGHHHADRQDHGRWLIARRTHEAGQAFPIYIMVVAGLLFLAFAYFAVGQASMKKNEAQTAADAAALAAAQDARDEWSWPGVFDLEQWDDLLNGRGAVSGACGAADWLAAENDAHLTGPRCYANDWPEVSYTVTVETNKSVGDSVITSTKTTKATA